MSNAAATTCTDSVTYTISVIPFDICLTEYVYDHANKKATTSGSMKYTASGSGPYTITFLYYSDTACKTSSGSGTATVSDTCAADGSGLTSDGTYMAMVQHFLHSLTVQMLQDCTLLDSRPNATVSRILDIGILCITYHLVQFLTMTLVSVVPSLLV